MKQAFGLLLLLFVANGAMAQMDFRQETIASFEIAQNKVIGLAEVLTDDQYAWRPAEGVRSVEEVIRHIAGTNYWMLTQMGCQPPAETGFTGDYSSVVAFETAHGRPETETVLAASFVHLRACTEAISDERLAQDMDLFGTPGSGQGYLMLTSTHLHEHLGQLVAYARMNGVVPPWSN
ncbi:MAG: DinB family protein [Rhodothermales bacterium]|nr:DinB family protein [Rhodothermales bacterium]MBO6780668.1 DinB family protein [Rhodothermales bacterium]